MRKWTPSNWYQKFVDEIAISLARHPEYEDELEDWLSRVPQPWKNEVRSLVLERVKEYLEQGGGSTGF